jgi:hypothetical protein
MPVSKARRRIGWSAFSAAAKSRVRQKYGAEVDLSGWSWRAEPVPKTAGAAVVRFTLDAGQFMRL